MTFDGFPSSVTTADKKTPTKIGANTNCQKIGFNTVEARWEEMVRRKTRKKLLPDPVKVAKLRPIIR